MKNNGYIDDLIFRFPLHKTRLCRCYVRVYYYRHRPRYNSATNAPAGRDVFVIPVQLVHLQTYCAPKTRVYVLKSRVTYLRSSELQNVSSPVVRTMLTHENTMI
uniref:Uncharacterized protein n=1 Tax=Sipha flava TaxID=143950 RepID=A0A2S2R287_9HEMI